MTKSKSNSKKHTQKAKSNANKLHHDQPKIVSESIKPTVILAQDSSENKEKSTIINARENVQAGLNMQKNMTKNKENTSKTSTLKDNPALKSTKSFFKDQAKVQKLTAATVGIVTILGTCLFSFYIIPQHILTQTDEAQAIAKDKANKEKIAKEKQDRDDKIAKENSVLKFDQNKVWKLNMNIKDFGTLDFTMKTDDAPKTVENFVRLAYRGYYNSTSIHRMVVKDSFKVIQGGDAEKGDGTGGKSALYINETQPENVPDELWLTKPEYETKDGKTVIKNSPKFRNDGFYKNFDSKTGLVEYPKGLILMAKTQSPDSASSQFFITLDKTVLPAEYTAFGVVSPEGLKIIDKMLSQVKPQAASEDQGDNTDGKPDKELKIEKIEIVSPKV